MNNSGTDNLRTFHQLELNFNPDNIPVSLLPRKWWVDRSNPGCPFHEFIGNDRAVASLSRYAHEALGKYNHCASDMSIALLGPSSTGKTTLARMFAKILGLPFIEISPKSIRTLDDIFFKISSVCENTTIQGLSYGEVAGIDAPDGTSGKYSLELNPTIGRNGEEYPDNNHFTPPPCVLFIDEVHGLAPNIVQGLLKATEKNDGMLDTGRFIVDCKNVCWIIATTERGLLFDAFDNRFDKVFLNLYSKQEMAKIVRVHNPDFDNDVCNLVAHYNGHIPREALSFAKAMQMEMNMRPSDWSTIAGGIAEERGIDKWGMTTQRVEILKALGKYGALAKTRICDIAACKEEELVRYVTPPLVSMRNGEPLVRVTNRGFEITAKGLLELDKRGIAYPKKLHKELGEEDI